MATLKPSNRCATRALGLEAPRAHILAFDQLSNTAHSEDGDKQDPLPKQGFGSQLIEEAAARTAIC